MLCLGVVVHDGRLLEDLLCDEALVLSGKVNAPAHLQDRQCMHTGEGRTLMSTAAHACLTIA